MSNDLLKADAFAANWLALREPADHAARASSLEERLQTALRARSRPWQIVDLGAGTGSNARYLAPRLPGAQHWHLIDHDKALLDQARNALTSLRHPAGHDLTFDFDLRSIASLEDALDRPCDLVTASALIDLVSANWITALADRVASLECSLLITLSVDGSWHFVDDGGTVINDDTDARMLARYRAHQSRDKGLGAALGGTAPGVLADRLRRRGLNVFSEPSPWLLEAGQQIPLARQLLAGWREALEAQAPDLANEINAWAADRDRSLCAGHLGVIVGHTDLLALPQ